MKRDQNLVWIDLEMSGLDPEVDAILEIATIITDSQLNILAEGPSFVIHQSDIVLEAMGEWCKLQHAKSGLTQAVRSSTTTLQEAENQTLEFIKEHCGPNTALLSGSSVWQDRFFLRKYMPSIIYFLHYKIIDVTTVKELVSRWYPHNPKINVKSKEAHRALDDIRESIAALQHFREFFFVQTKK
jgi:oligoribonuclease